MSRHLTAIVSFLFAGALLGQSPTPLSVVVGQDEIRISNATPGGAVVLVSCARTIRSGGLMSHQSAINLVVAADGVVRFKPPGSIPLRSVWVAVDRESGATAAAAPADYPLIVRRIKESFLKKDAEGEIAEFVRDVSRLNILLVRPRGGAWLLTGREGGSADRDGRSDGKLSLAFEAARAVGGKERAPKHLKVGDVVVTIDPGHLDVYVAEVGK